MKAVLVIDEMPKSCAECKRKYQDESYVFTLEYRCAETCGFVTDYTKHRPDWCPLKPLPKHADLPDDPYDEFENGCTAGWNMCLDQIEA